MGGNLEPSRTTITPAPSFPFENQTVKKRPKFHSFLEPPRKMISSSRGSSLNPSYLWCGFGTPPHMRKIEHPKPYCYRLSFRGKQEKEKRKMRKMAFPAPGSDLIMASSLWRVPVKTVHPSVQFDANIGPFLTSTF